MQTHIVPKPSDFDSLSVTSAAIALAEPPTDVVGGILVIEDNDVRMRADGEDPVSGSGGGLLMKADSIWEIEGRDWFTGMKFIADAGDAVVTVHYISGG